MKMLSSPTALRVTRRPKIVAWCHTLLCAAQIGPALAQFKLQEPFTGTTAPGWAISRIALLTAPSIDVDGHGWLRLTNTSNTTKGLALDTAQSFPGQCSGCRSLPLCGLGRDRVRRVTRFRSAGR